MRVHAKCGVVYNACFTLCRGSVPAKQRGPERWRFGDAVMHGHPGSYCRRFTMNTVRPNGDVACGNGEAR